MPCKCGHGERRHGKNYAKGREKNGSGRSTYLDQFVCYGFCTCEKYEEIDNLRYCELKALPWYSMFKHLMYAPAYLIRYAWLMWFSKSVFEALLGTALAVVVTFASIWLPQVVVSEHKDRVYKIEHMKVDCYTGDKLLYSGPVSDMPYMSNGAVRVRTSANEEFVCTGYHELVK